MRRDSRQDGHSILEIATVMVLMGGLGILGMSTLVREHEFVNQEFARFEAEKISAELEGRISGLIEGASIAMLDTAFRSNSAALQSGSDRLTVSYPGFVQCTSPTCGAHTSKGIVTDTAALTCAREFVWFPGTEKVRGRIWPASETKCPLDGAPVAPTICVDGFQVVTSSSGFNAGTGKVDLDTLTFVLPFPRDDTLALHRYDLRIADILGGTVTSTPGWSRWVPDMPSIVDLLDFGKNGTTDGSPDGVLSIGKECDAEIDKWGVWFNPGTQEWECYMYRALHSGASVPQRKLDITIRLRDGLVTYDFLHEEADGETWQANGSFLAKPKVVIEGVTEFAVSCYESNPYEPTLNPRGVKPGMVRVTVGTATRRKSDKGVIEWSIATNTELIVPRR